MIFSYKIHTNTGEIISGVQDAQDKKSAILILKSKGRLLFIDEEKKKQSFISFLESKSLFTSVKLQEKILFTKNLSGMIKAGLSLSRALDVLTRQTKNIGFKKILFSLIQRISEGDNLSRAMEKFPKVFSPLFVSMIRAGEESGTLADSLKQIGFNLEKVYSLNKKVKSAMMYPSIIIGAIFLIAILMLIYVVPTLTKTFTELGVELPATTKFIIALSDFISNNTISFFITIFVLASLFIFLLKVPRFVHMIDYIILRLPVIGTISRETNSARVTRTLSSLLSSGVSVTRALSIVRDVVGNWYYVKAIDDMILTIEKGGTLSSIFKSQNRLFPIMVGEMVEVGEETGNLSSMLSDIAIFYEGEVDSKLKDLSTIIEPVLMVLIGGAVGFFAVSMISPMYSLMDSIK